MKLCAALFFLAIAGTSAWAEIRFEDRASGLPEHVYLGGWEHFVGGGVAVFDCNNDGLLDLYAAGGEAAARLMVNQGDFEFETARSPEITAVTGAYPIDIDGDRVLDLFVLRVGPNIALRGLGDCAFEDATEDWGLPTRDAWTTAFTAWWAPGETRPTLVVGNYVDRSDPGGPFGTCDTHEILRPGGAGYSAESLGPGYCTLSILAAQDASGQHRLRISNDRHYYLRGGHEQMYDIATNRFLGPEDGWEQVSLWGMGIASRDITGDGRDEVMLTSMGDQLMQIAQDDGTYRAAPFDLGTYAQRPHVGEDGRPSTGWHAEFGDVDNDGRADLFIAKGNVDQMPGLATRDPNNLLIQTETGRFEEVSVSAGVATLARSRGASLADIDRDGRLDLVVMNRRAPMEIYRNISTSNPAWLAIELDLPINRFGIGYHLDVSWDGGRERRQITLGGGHAGGQIAPVHFGLGTAQDALVRVFDTEGKQIFDGRFTAGQVVRVNQAMQSSK
ncbi:MAG: CRTAC1 family protein [Pseudomonadota bacterium]